MRQPQPTLPNDLPTVALLLHTAVPAATDHPYRKHHLDPDGEHAELFAEQFTGPDQPHRFAHEPTAERAILALVLDPLVDQILAILGQLPRDLHPIVLAEAALATRLLDAPAQPVHLEQLADDEPPTRSRPQ